MNIELNKYGLRDKQDQGPGLVQRNPTDAQFSVNENTLIVDTRDCIGTKSLADAKLYFEYTGGNGPSSGHIINATGLSTYPITVTFDSVATLNDGDVLIFKGVQGNTNINGVHTISGVTPGPNTAILSISPNGNYQGGGIWEKKADSGYPKITDKDSTIFRNVITINLENELKFIRSLTLFHIVIPRDIIPLEYLLSDFITTSTSLENISYAGLTDSVYTTYIPQEAKMLSERIIGFFSSPLDTWRTYIDSSFSMPNQITPPPHQLWNPPGPGAWPLQPLPYPFQTVPTYKSNNFNVGSLLCYVVLAGYGVYDLVDWTIDTGSPVTDSIKTSIIRKLLLILICPIQSYQNVDYIDLILNSNVISNLNPVAAYGFGDYQRYVPGPGLQLNYQPNSNTAYTAANGSGPPNVAQIDSPIPFPSFRGNVWGPYNNPGDRFQKIGVRDIIQDLYLNGDLNNLFGSPIILSDVPSEGIVLSPLFGLNFSSLISVDIGNIATSLNPNILNAMRIKPNGFGAAVVRATGSGALYTSSYNSASGFGAGGIGPSNLGTPNAWVNSGIYGAGTFTDKIAQGFAGPNITVASSDASYIGTGADPKHNTSYYDFGPENGSFISAIQRYTNYAVNDIPDTDLIIKIQEADRTERAQCTQSSNSGALLDVPIRLNLGSTSGTIQYIESLQSLLAQATAYWQKRYINSKSSINKLHLFLFDYAGRPIPLEKMLQLRGVSQYLQNLVKIDNFFNSSFDFKDFLSFSYLFDPLNPHLYGRVKRYMQIIFKVETYDGTPPGLEPTSMLPYDLNNVNYQ